MAFQILWIQVKIIFFEFPQEIISDIQNDLYEESNEHDESSSQSSDSYNTKDEKNK